MKIRIKFRKYGNLKFIGHLDVQRYFQKTVRRADIDVAYTTGFSPHQIMSFAAPLGVGLESNGEYMDVELNTFTGSSDTVRRLNEVGAEGIEVLSAKVLPPEAGNAMASVAAAAYMVRFREGREPSFDWRTKVSEFYAKETIVVTKETKSGSQEIDLKAGIYQMESRTDGIYLLVNASSSGNIKPSLVMDIFFDTYGDKVKENALCITREETYMNEGTEDNPSFVPLDNIGRVCEEVLHE